MIAGGSGAACNSNDGENQIAAETRSAITISAPVALRPRAPDSVAGDQFGWSLSVSGNTAVISANNSVKGIAGGVFVFQKANDAWSQVAKLAIPDDSPATDWGYVVATDGARIAVTSLSGDGTGSGAGIYTFVGSGSSWTFEERIPPPQSDFAEKLAVSGDTLAASNFGRVWVYVRANGHWTAQSLPSPGPAAVAFGDGIAIHGDRLAVGAPLEDVNGVLQAGAVYVFDRVASTWSAPTRLVAPDPMVSDNLGTSMAVEGDTVAAGAFFNAGGGSPAPFRNGRTLVFVKQGSAWQSISFPGLDRTAGESVAMSGRRIVFGSQGEVSGTIGAVHILERTNGVWAEAQNLKSTSTLDIDFGWRLGLMPDGLLVGCPTFSQTVVGNPTPGTAYAYGLNRLLGEAGEACASSTDCETGFCADGVCCATACGGGVTNDCQACSVAAGGTQDGVCTALSATAAGTVTCRPAIGACDVAEVCVSGNTSCPGDSHAVDGTNCDEGVVCNGVSICQAGACQAGTPPTCPDDDDPCTTAACAEPGGCRQVAIPGCTPPPRDAGSDASDTHNGAGGTGAGGSGVGGGTGAGGGGVGGGGAGGSGVGGGGAGGSGVGGGGAGGSGVGGGGPADAGGDLSSHDGCSCATSGTVPRPLSTAGFSILAVVTLLSRRGPRLRHRSRPSCRLP